MQNVFEADIYSRSQFRERSAALIESWEFLLLLNHALQDLCRRSLCFEKEALVRAEDEIRKYEWKYVLPDFNGKLRQAWYRDEPISLLTDIGRTSWAQGHFTSTSSQPLSIFYDSQFFEFKGIPSVTEYSTGTALFTKGSRTVTGTSSLWSTGTNPPGAHWGIGTGTEPGKLYPIRSINSETEIELQEPFLEATTTSTTYLATNGAIRLHYVAKPAVVRTLSYVTNMAGNITVTDGSRTVTCSGAPAWLTNARRGMHFGVGTATSTTKPSRWYIIRKVVSNTELELAQPYEEATNAAASGVLTDDSPLEPGFMEIALRFVIGAALEKYGHPESKFFLQNYEAGVQQVKSEVDLRYQRMMPPPRIRMEYVPEFDG